MRFMNMLFAFPIILPSIGIIAVLGPNFFTATITIAIVNVPILARLLRGPSLVICQSEYIKGTEIIGASEIQILYLHLLPNLASVILAKASLLLSATILVEASLSVLGLGAQPPVP